MTATLHDAGPAVLVDWPARFEAEHGRAPRVLHIGNIANYAWTNAVMMRRRGIDCVVFDPDSYHMVSAPEWVEADVQGDPGDPFHPRWSALRVPEFRRPEWLINGPTPFALRELAAREQGRRAERVVYALLSNLYRRGLASRADRPSLFRKAMESRGGVAVAAKALLKSLTLGRRSASSPQALPASGGQPVTEAAVPPGMPKELLLEAMQHFDIVIGYALGARFAMAADHPRFVSLEIGTLRGLVFEETPLGRLAAEVYRRSPSVFVTNVDVLDAASRLGLDPDRLVPLPHPFDLEQAEASPVPTPTGGPPVFFAPARHHWRGAGASWLKGNDVLIEGAALLARNGVDFRLRFVRWGEDLAASRALIAERGLAERCEWIDPLPRPRLWREIHGSAAVLDQFAASAFGGVALETMALGRRIISKLGQPALAPFFRSKPPIIHAATPDEVSRRMLEVLEDPEDRNGIGAAGRSWMREEHGPVQQLGRQFAAFERLVAEHGPARPAA